MTDRGASARQLFEPEPGTIYLDAATYGLPPRPTIAALDRAAKRWQMGAADWIQEWDQPSDSCRADFAALIGGTASEVAAIPAASVGVAMVAATLGAGDEVLVPEGEFTSVLFPLLVAAQRGVVVRELPLADLAGGVTPATRLVAFSQVQMQTGRSADVAGVCAAARRHGARVLLDATQGVPFVDLAPVIGDIDYVVCAAYKHLLCPRGVAFLHVRRDRWAELPPVDANWRSADKPYDSYFGGPLRLAPDAARFDVSRAWFPWVGAIESLRLLVEWKAAGLLDDVLALARTLAEQIGITWGGDTLVNVPVDDLAAAQAAVRDAGIRISARGRGLRLAPHVWNTAADIERAAAVVRPLVARRDG
jgi:selenocysteine lyase/cysteine desulfurase